MNRKQAQALLDRVKDGQEFDYADITAALVACGDVEPWRYMVPSLALGMRGEGMDNPLPIESPADWEGASVNVVARDEREHSQSQGQGWSRYLDCRNEQAQV